MALNLSTLTSPTTSGDVLAEMLTTADFLDPVPVLKNIARGSNKGGDAKQTTALNQPKALPLIDGKGYLYLSNAAANYASIPDSSELDVTGDITLECDFIVPEFPLSEGRTLLAKYNTSMNVRSYTLFLDSSGNVNITLSQDGTFNAAFQKSKNFSSVLSGKTRATVKVTWRQSDGRTQFFFKESDGSFTQVSDDVTLAATSIYNSNLEFEIGTRNSGQSTFGSSLGVFGARIYASINDTNKVLDVDFTATNIRHGDTKFQCATGQTVTINQSGNDPATVIKRSVLRFDGADDFMSGVFGQTIDSGYMFAAFSFLGNGGEPYGRVFSVNSTGAEDNNSSGGIFSLRNAASSTLDTYYQGNYRLPHVGIFADSNGDVLQSVKITNGNQSSLVNDADLQTATLATSISSEEFNICVGTPASLNNAAIDLEFLALFPATITDAEAARVVTYINTRNNVFDLKDGFGYYFYDGTKAPVGSIISGSSSWNGRIVGSDNGDVDQYATQATSSNQPVSDGYKVTFADNTDFLTIPSTAQAGWQVVGTSLGTFAYRVNANAVTELNLLGNLGSASYRQAGQSYGMLLLPETANGKQIEDARKLLIDRGAADGVTGSSLATYWLSRGDIVEFKGLNTSGVNSFYYTWHSCGSLTSFPFIDTSSGTNFQNSWFGNASLTSFPALDMSSGATFQNAWNACTALTSFPAGAKLGTAAENVNFSSAWRSSGLTSFPALDLSKGNNFDLAWIYSPLSEFSADAKLGTNAVFGRTFESTLLTSFETPITTGRYFYRTWNSCNLLVDFSADVFANWSPSVISSYVFYQTWSDCTALTAQSVENILTSIDTSGQSAPSTGPQINIDYNVATGALSAATNTAITSLRAKGWQVVINGVITIPNVLSLAPAVAYSLRSFDSAADPNVVNVRRSSDSATSDFKASEVSDGTLTTWVGSGNDGYVTTWYDQGGTLHAAQSTASRQPKIVESGVLVTEGGLPSINFHTELSNLGIAHSALTIAATLDSYYVTNATGAAYMYPSLITNGAAYGMVASVSSSFANLAANYGSPTYYANGTQITGTTRGDIHTATSGGQKLVAHIGADTTNSAWRLSNMNFGNYINDNSFGYTGKLQEMIFFNTDQSANRTGIEKNINDTYTIY